MPADPTMCDLIEDIEQVRATLTDEVRATAIERLGTRGKLSACTRLDRLVDAGTFDEIGGLVAAEEDGIGARPTRTLSPADGVVVGTARIEGRPAMVFSQDFSVFGGSIGRLGSAKNQRALGIAIDRGLPLLMILDGGAIASRTARMRATSPTPTRRSTISPAPRARSRCHRSARHAPPPGRDLRPAQARRPNDHPPKYRSIAPI
jgi:acetyl-CoA carboxylase carboxyltransferase component